MEKTIELEKDNKISKVALGVNKTLKSLFIKHSLSCDEQLGALILIKEAIDQTLKDSKVNYEMVKK